MWNPPCHGLSNSEVSQTWQSDVNIVPMDPWPVILSPEMVNSSMMPTPISGGEQRVLAEMMGERRINAKTGVVRMVCIVDVETGTAG